MAITAADIKLLKSERMQDTDDGGGRMTGQEVIDGQSNNLFPDISELDRTYGRVSLRKVFPAVITSTTDVYYGANVIVAQPPEDERVHAHIFQLQTSDAWFAERSSAQNKMESYLTIGALSPMRLVGDHFEGQRSLLCYQQLTDPLPDVGSVYVLKDSTNEQYVRVLRVESRTVTYYDDKGPFDRTELTVQISDPLRYNFDGGTVSRYTSYVPPTQVYRTNAIEAVSYYGIAPLAQPTDLGAQEIRVSRTKGPVLPSTQAESAVLDARAGSLRTIAVSGGARTAQIGAASATKLTVIRQQNRGYTYVAQLNPKPAPKTLEVGYRARDRWYYIMDQDGDGSLKGGGAGVVNYTTGSVSVTLAELPDVDTVIMWSWGTTTEYDTPTITDIVTPRWEHTLQHLPVVPSSVTITWQAGGQTKTATDNGAGVISGNASGYINYASGVLYFHPTELPDPQTSPQIAYQAYTTKYSETFAQQTPVNNQVTVTLQNQPAARGIKIVYTVRIGDWISDTAPRLVYNGERQPLDTVITPSGLNGASFKYRYIGTNWEITLTSGSNGELPWGSIDFQSKQVTLPVALPFQFASPVYEHSCEGRPCGEVNGVQQYCTVCGNYVVGYEYLGGSGYTSAINGKVDVSVEYRDASSQSADGKTENVPAQNVILRLTPTSEASVVPGTVQFVLNGATYIDVEGEIQRVPSGGFGTPAGTIDYDTGDATITLWTAGTLSFTLQSLAVQRYPKLGAVMDFRANAPARPASFTFAVVASNGEQLTAEGLTNGVVEGDYVDGSIDYHTGAVWLRFGQWRLASGLTEDEKRGWFSEDQVRQDGYVWVPRKVRLDTARYNIVSYVYMPLSETILGLDPVRLPMDGKVPIFRVGDVIVVHHTQQTSIANPYNGQTINTGRVRLAYARLFDANGAAVATDRYTVNLDAGTVTLVNVTGLATPLRLEDRIEDMALVSDLQINGTLTLTRALSHAYPTGSYVSSALVIGDMWARVSVFFHQATWTGEWKDTRIGSDTTAKYNRTAYPIGVTNKGAITERWAIIFTSSTAFKLVGEYVGQIALGNINENFAPPNPETNEPYFTIDYRGWGSGWATGNVVRLNTIGANYPIWIARTVLQSEAASGSDQFRICVRGDVDTP